MRFPPLLRKLKRGPQVVLPKDIGLILGFTSVGKESVCLDAGAGSGWLAISLGNVCKKVTAYEWREDFVQLAESNVERAGLKNVKIKHGSVFDGISETDLDLVTLDLADSDKAVPQALAALKPGGYLVGYVPHAEQAQRFAAACKTAGVPEHLVFCLEAIVREMLCREQGFRPENMGLQHTAYLVFAQKPEESKIGGKAEKEKRPKEKQSNKPAPEKIDEKNAEESGPESTD